MARYIDAELLKEVVLGWEPPLNDKQLEHEIDTMSTADVAEVKHGEWMQTTEPLGWQDVDCIECSACRESWIMHEELSLDEYVQGWKYCPNCGAKMDGGKAE